MPDPVVENPTGEVAPMPKHLNPLGNWMNSVVSTLPNPSISGPATPEPSNEPAPEKPVGTVPAQPSTVPATEPKPAVDKPTGVEPVVEAQERKWPRSAQQWEEYKKADKERLSQRETKIKELETKLTEAQSKLSSTPVDQKEYEALKAERDTLSERLKVSDVVRHPRFEAYFNGKTTAQIELAKRVVGPDLQAQAEKVLKMPESEYRNQQIEEIMAGLGPIQQSRFGGILNALSEIDSERQREIDNAKNSYESLSKAQQDRAKKIQDDFKSAVETTLSTVSDPKNGLPQWQKRDGDTAWNESVDARVAEVRSLLSGQITDPKVVIQAAMDAVSMRAVLNDYKSLMAEYKKLEAQVKTLSAANPAPNGEQPRTEQEPGRMPPVKAGSRPMEVTQGWVKGMVAARGQP